MSFTLVLVMVLALAVPAFATGNLYSKANEWYYNADEAGTLTVKDNKVTYTYEVKAGVNFLGLQKGYTGQLKLVGFEAAPVIVDPVLSLLKAELEEWINKAFELIRPIQDYMKVKDLWNTEECQALYYYAVDAYHNVLNNPCATIEDVQKAIDNIKKAYDDTLALWELEHAIAELKDWCDTAFVLIRQIQNYMEVKDLWNTDPCQALYKYIVDYVGETLLVDPDLSVADVKEATANVIVLYEKLLAIWEIELTKIELTEYCKEAFIVIRQLQYFEGKDLWNTDECQYLYCYIVDYITKDLMVDPDATIDDYTDALDVVRVLHAAALDFWALESAA